MKFNQCSFLSGLLVAITLLLSPMGTANEAYAQERDPYQKIENITAKLVGIIGEHQQGYPGNEADYFLALSLLLDTAVDFKNISRLVMGPYAKKASPDQRKLFLEKFRMDLVKTYGRGLISFGNEQILLVDRKPLQDGQRRLIVKQEIHSEGSVFPLQYSMARKKTGEWMILNVIINGINLRKTFRGQFNQAAQKSGGDLDAVISQWASEAD